MPTPARRKPPKPTDAELAILRVLWQRGPSTVRQVRTELPPDTGYTTVLKFLQIINDRAWWCAMNPSAPTCIRPPHPPNAPSGN